MRTVVIHKANDLRIENAAPTPPDVGQVQIKISVGGICGSDLHYYNHGGFGPVRLKEPMILGHEVSGTVIALGEGADGFEIGELVSVSPSRPCDACQYCESGLKNHCENMRFYGSAMPFPHIQGAFRELLNVDVSQCVSAAGLGAGEAAMAEPLSVALHAVNRAGDLNGKRVLITGTGPIGTLCVLAARHAGAEEIVTTDLVNKALTFAKSCGADKTINIAEQQHGLSDYQKGKGSFDILFECSGSPQALADGIAAMRPRGVVMQLGLGGDMTIPMQQLTAKELDLRGSFRFHEEFAKAVDLMRTDAIDVKPLISHEVSLAEAETGFRQANDRNSAMKVQIAFS